MSSSEIYAFRLNPGDDLLTGLQHFADSNSISAGWIATCVGSLTKYNIRFANMQQSTSGEGHFEIVSLIGTLSRLGSHVHIAISDSTGKTLGGHLVTGNIIYTTAEIVIQTSGKYIFKREMDGTTPWKELQVLPVRRD